MKRKRIVSLIVFLIGVVILLYPMISREYYDYVYREEVEIIKEDITHAEVSNDLYQQQMAYNSTEIGDLGDIEVTNVGFIDEESQGTVDLSDENLLGTLSIPAIDLNYPIYDGATDENLYNGVARIEGTSYPVGGMNTHSVIAGHNGLVGKTYFSDIRELEQGDIIEVQNSNEVITYEVYEHEVIEPSDISALEIIQGQDTLTLLTCTYPPPGTHRYLVYARRIPNKTKEARTSMETVKNLENN